MVNRSAAHVNHDVQYRHDEAASFDHVPIAISSFLQAFNVTTTVAVQPAKIQVRNLQTLSVKQRSEFLTAESVMYAEMWKGVATDFETALANKDIDAADQIW